MKKLNINTEVTVKLTEGGAEAYNVYARRLNLYCPGALKTEEKHEGDTLTTELWSIMYIFGSEMYMGNPRHPLFEENLLELEVKK